MAKYMPDPVKGMKIYGRHWEIYRCNLFLLKAKPFYSLFTIKRFWCKMKKGWTCYSFRNKCLNLHEIISPYAGLAIP